MKYLTNTLIFKMLIWISPSIGLALHYENLPEKYSINDCVAYNNQVVYITEVDSDLGIYRVKTTTGIKVKFISQFNVDTFKIRCTTNLKAD